MDLKDIRRSQVILAEKSTEYLGVAARRRISKVDDITLHTIDFITATFHGLGSQHRFRSHWRDPPHQNSRI